MAPEEAIFLTMLALLSPGDHVICTFPGYQSLYEARPRRCPARACWQWDGRKAAHQCHAVVRMGMAIHLLLSVYSI